MILTAGEREDCSGIHASPTVAEQIASSDENESQQYSKGDSDDTTRCEPAHNKHVSIDPKSTRWEWIAYEAVGCKEGVEKTWA